jgi:phage terminase large subunit
MAVWRGKFGLRGWPARKSNMRRLSYEWLAGLREIVIDLVRCPLAYKEFRLKEFEHDHNGSWVNETLDRNDHSIDTVRYVAMDDVLRSA